MLRYLSLALLCAAVLAITARAADPRRTELFSPDKHFRVRVFITAEGTAAYRVDWHGQPLIVASALGLELDNQPGLADLEITGTTITSHDETWQPVCGERAEVRNHYCQATVELREKAASHRCLQVVVRAYDAGVAFHYQLPEQPGLADVTVTRDLTEFRFPADHPCWATPSAQGRYQRVASTQLPAGTERPLLVEAGKDCFLALTEARLVDFSRGKFSRLSDGTPGVAIRLDGRVKAKLPLRTPWRVVMAASSPAGLLQNNDLIRNLNDPCAIADTSWIKPGKVLREVTLTTDGAKRTVDYCAAHGIAYMIFDAGWYGAEESPDSDATAVHLDPRRSKGPLDLAEVIRYASDKNVGVILYVNYIAMTRQLEQFLPLYRRWGVKGVKYGFVETGGQDPTNFVNQAIRLAAQNHLMVDIHDEWRPTGLERTWPNLMTSEGILGDEEASRDNAQSLVAQFARFLAGPADNTVCYFDPRVERSANHAYQLAKSVCFFSPWQFIHWYDRPLQSNDVLKPGDRVIGKEPELKFFDRLPTAWDDTRVLDGAIGEFSVIARRKGDDWWIGCMNAKEPRTVRIELNFLSPGQRYEAALYAHDPEIPTRTHVGIERRGVSSADTLSVDLGKNDGQAIEITPVGTDPHKASTVPRTR